MKEKKIFQEIPSSKNKFHSAILTSFSFGFHHFEYQVLKVLKQKWVSNVGLLVDSKMLDKSVGLDSAGLSQLSHSYSINGIHCPGAFHPKINFIIGDEQALMVFGSGNITPGGHGKNHETFTSLYADSKESKLTPLIQEGWNYIQYLAKSLDGYSKERIFELIPKNCILLNDKKFSKHNYQKLDDTTDIALLYNDETSILSQILTLIPVESITTIKIVCPYYDEDGALLLQLAMQFPNAKLEVYIPKEKGLPPLKMAESNRITFYSWEETDRGKKSIAGKNQYDRKLHSKIYNFEAEGITYFMIGSANATIAAFGTAEKRGLNEEFGALYKSSKVNYFKELSISKSKKINNFDGYTRAALLTEEATNEVHNQIKLKVLGCDLGNLRMTVYVKTNFDINELKVLAFNGLGIQLFERSTFEQTENKIQFSITFQELKLNPTYVVLQNNRDEVISNKSLINYIEKLYYTDPSKENRTIRGILNDLDLGKINEFQILEYINSLRTNREVVETVKVPNRVGANDFREAEQKKEMTYEEAVAASKNKEVGTKISQTYSVIQIWGMLSKLFYENAEKNSDVINDEEELASATEGAKRNEKPIIEKSTQTLKSNVEALKLLKKTDKLVADYTLSVGKISRDRLNKINEISLCQFLVVTKVLTVIYNFTEFNLPPSDKLQATDLIYTPDKWKKFTKSSYAKYIMDMAVGFATLFNRNEIETYADDDFRKVKFDEYFNSAISDSIVYLSLIYKGINEKQLQQTIELALIIIIDKFNSPLNNFEEYVSLLSQSTNDSLSLVSNAIVLKKRLYEDVRTIDTKQKYFRHPYLGVCLILEKEEDKISFKSIVDLKVKYTIPVKEFSKL